MSDFIDRTALRAAVQKVADDYGADDAVLAILNRIDSAAPPAATEPSQESELRAAVEALFDAEAHPAYSWVIESQEARREGRPNREVERMDRIAEAKRKVRALLASDKAEP